MWTRPTTIIGFHKDCRTRIHTLIKNDLVADGRVITDQTALLLVCREDEWICNTVEMSLTVQAGVYILFSCIVKLSLSFIIWTQNCKKNLLYLFICAFIFVISFILENLCFHRFKWNTQLWYWEAQVILPASTDVNSPHWSHHTNNGGNHGKVAAN